MFSEEHSLSLAQSPGDQLPFILDSPHFLDKLQVKDLVVLTAVLADLNIIWFDLRDIL